MLVVKVMRRIGCSQVIFFLETSPAAWRPITFHVHLAIVLSDTDGFLQRWHGLESRCGQPRAHHRSLVERCSRRPGDGQGNVSCLGPLDYALSTQKVASAQSLKQGILNPAVRFPRPRCTTSCERETLPKPLPSPAHHTVKARFHTLNMSRLRFTAWGKRETSGSSDL
jgi:hypothetical protein